VFADIKRSNLSFRRIKMKNVKGFVLGLVLGLGLALSGVGLAQTTTQTDQNKKAESCCAMESCCCRGDSCSMKHQGMEHAKKEHSQHSQMDSCCCGGDSCDMKMKEDKPKQ
jgi:hypothetical protein